MKADGFFIKAVSFILAQTFVKLFFFYGAKM